jgi:hypothetical protein
VIILYFVLLYKIILYTSSFIHTAPYEIEYPDVLYSIANRFISGMGRYGVPCFVGSLTRAHSFFVLRGRR